MNRGQSGKYFFDRRIVPDAIVPTLQRGKGKKGDNDIISLRKHYHISIVYCVTAYRSIHGLCTELWTLVALWAQYSSRIAKEVQSPNHSAINTWVNAVLYFLIS
jgi:hypothetical protein